MKDNVRIIEIQPNLIMGVMLGIEYVEDEGWSNLIIDLFVLRIMISWN
jgi:hypothetical protein